jgi:hypothetical protein
MPKRCSTSCSDLLRKGCSRQVFNDRIVLVFVVDAG